jgi:starch synthase|uniref:glycogen synthase GlgA n=2 Tax=Cephaloticoccus sp. TaxID=1985742 RepID=UPI00404AEAFD
MKIVHVASEMFPYVKTGGLADAVAALSGALADAGHEVSIFIPGYRTVLAHPDTAGAPRKLRLKIEMGDEFVSGHVRVFSPRPNLTVHLICRDEYFDRSHPYGNGERDYEDNADRFIYFAKGVVDALRLAELQADVVHAHDWQGALVPLFLRMAERRHGLTLAMKTVFTIHNIAFQGLFAEQSFYRTNLPDELNNIDGLEYYNQINLMKGGILFADRVTTVSPRYAQEIQSAEFGCGLDGVVQTRAEDIVGLLNGIDTAIWNPSIDPLLPVRYSVDDMKGKSVCRKALLQTHNMDPKFNGPIFGMVCRMTEQKGIDLLLANEAFFLKENCRLIMLGSGEKRYEDALKELAARASGKIALSLKLDERASHLIEAGADFFVMASLFEPCGLNQMYSQAYGTVPLVSEVGGLADTVVDTDRDTGHGTGITFPATEKGLAGGLTRAMRLFANPKRFTAVQKRGMAKDFGWKNAAMAYEQLYSDSL